MIIDLRTQNEPLKLACDLCIVGTGAAGLAIASEMRGTPLRLVLIESGGMQEETTTQALYDVDISGLPHLGSTQGRFRVWGGSTARWGGQALPLMRSDFERREWVAYSGWPITFDELQPYYTRASRFLLVDEMNFDTDLFNALRTKPPAFDPHQVWYHFSKWSPQPSVRERHLSAIRDSDRCTLLLHANVKNIASGKNLNDVESLDVQSLDGHQATVRAKTFVLCAGGIETARLLLANNKQQPNGIGNQNDLVGRFFQDHPNAAIGWLHSSNSHRVQKLFNVFHKRGIKYSVRCTASSQWQRKNQTLSTSMGMMFPQEDSALQDLKSIYSGVRSRKWNESIWAGIHNVASHPGAIISPVWHYAVRRRSFAPKAKMQIYLTCEQEPNPESRILLSEKTDALGMRRADVRWQLTELTRQTMQRFAEVLRSEFQRLDIGNIVLEPWFNEDWKSWVSNMNDQYHHIGTARMHDSARHGVVDRDCKIHGMKNIYIGSSAVFPTSGHSNPTLTIIALCMRLADRLKDTLKHSE